MNFNFTPVTFLSSAARTATVDSGAVRLHYVKELLVLLDVTAASGTPTMTMHVQTQDAAGNWYTLVSFPAVTGVSRTSRAVSFIGDNVRVRCEIGGGTPSLTFSVTAIAKEMP